MTLRALLLTALLFPASAALAAGADPRGKTYTSEDLVARPPGPQWKLHEKVEGAPLVRGLYTFHRAPEADGRSRSSLISFTIENEPQPAEPAAYVKTIFDEYFKQPPLSFKVKQGSAVTVKGMPGYRVDYADRDDIRQFTQVALKMADGRLLIAVLQSQDAKAFAEDAAPFKTFLDGLTVKPARRRVASPASPTTSPKQEP